MKAAAPEKEIRSVIGLEEIPADSEEYHQIMEAHYERQRTSAETQLHAVAPGLFGAMIRPVKLMPALLNRRLTGSNWNSSRRAASCCLIATDILAADP
jgi:hypothetical protein